MKNVDIYTVKREVRTLEAGYVEFHEFSGHLSLPGEWAVPLNNPQVYVRHKEPVHQVTIDGEHVYLAMDPKLFELVAAAAHSGLHMRMREGERLLERAEDAIKQLRMDLQDQKKRADRWASDYCLASDKLSNIARASLWQRLKYLFTGSVQ